MKTLIKPNDMQYIWVTYKSNNETYRKRGFYCEMFNNVKIPHDWAIFNNYLLPNGFNSTKLMLEDVINWEYCIDWA